MKENASTAVVFLLLLAITTSVLYSGCKPTSTPPGDASRTAASGTFKMNCVLLYRDSMKKWVSKGWTNSLDSNSIKLILLQSYSPDAAQADSNNNVISFAATSYTRIFGDSVLLQIDPKCVAKEITGEVATTNNYINFKRLNITNADGSLKNDFTFIRFRPVMDSSFKPYISFEYEVVRSEFDSSIQSQKETRVRPPGRSDPCPIYCP